MKREINKILTKGKIIMQNHAPFDTGNLRFNAIKKLKTSGYGGLIRVDGRDAYYAQYLQELESSKHRGFIDRARAEIATMVIHEMNPIYKTRYVRLNKPELASKNLLAREELLLYSRLRYNKGVDVK